LKDTEPVLLKQALDTVLEKGYFHTELVTNSLMHALDSDDEDIKIVEFNEKELEFVKLACKENTYKEIAEIMCLSPKTIDNYRQNVFDKIGVRNRIGMVIYAIKNKIINI
jgi:DNA-binding NarL/FixJ family response regulator